MDNTINIVITKHVIFNWPDYNNDKSCPYMQC